MKIKTHVDFPIGNVSFSLGWYKGEDWTLLDVNILNFSSGILIVCLQILKFRIEIWIDF